MDIVERLRNGRLHEWHGGKSSVPNDAANEIERLRKILSTVLEACEDVNSPDRKVRKEIARTVGKALKEKE